MRVAFQGEAGAYSEKSLRELLGRNVIAVPRPNFESCYRAVASNECDYAIVPIENSLGGSIHENYDLMLRYDLTIVAEHDFRVRHCLLTKPGLDVGDVRYAISHPQALSQCDNYLRSRGIVPRPTYDTAGSAKMIRDCLSGGGGGEGVVGGRGMPEGCTPDNTAAIASNLAGITFGLECKEEGIEDDDSNFTRFLLLGRRGGGGVTGGADDRHSSEYTAVSIFPEELHPRQFAVRDVGDVIFRLAGVRLPAAADAPPRLLP